MTDRTRDELWWVEFGLCGQVDPDRWFPAKGAAWREVKRMCATCDVRRECLNYALEHNITDGIWGGFAPKARRKLRRQAGKEAA